MYDVPFSILNFDIVLIYPVVWAFYARRILFWALLHEEFLLENIVSKRIRSEIGCFWKGERDVECVYLGNYNELRMTRFENWE